ncbi:uncharacterized protein M421DRAFT_78418, partial [Didymella exigua CBS 183.55]
VTVIACVCADGVVLPPRVIYAAAGKDVQSVKKVGEGLDYVLPSLEGPRQI